MCDILLVNIHFAAFVFCRCVICVRVCSCACVFMTILVRMCESGYLVKQCNDQIFHIPALQLQYGEKYAECIYSWPLNNVFKIILMVYNCAYSTVRHTCTHLNI